MSNDSSPATRQRRVIVICPKCKHEFQRFAQAKPYLQRILEELTQESGHNNSMLDNLGKIPYNKQST